jgi:hypothetical protein
MNEDSSIRRATGKLSGRFRMVDLFRRSEQTST